jgi:hypothetical protein
MSIGALAIVVLVLVLAVQGLIFGFCYLAGKVNDLENRVDTGFHEIKDEVKK